jgi:hypothetical protein
MYVEWIRLAQGKDQGHVVVETAMQFRVTRKGFEWPKKCCFPWRTRLQ